MQVERNDGFKEMPEQVNMKKMFQALDREDVKEVHVFNLEQGMPLTIGKKEYTVEKINSKGKKTVVHLKKK